MAQKFLPDDHSNRPTMSDSASASDECGIYLCANPSGITTPGTGFT
ncbi:hypothetical protein ABIA64_003366 [Paenibacillus sp. RC253]